jgi:hypothetical protein
MRPCILVFALLAAVPLGAQRQQGTSRPAEHSGLSASLGVAPVQFDLGGGDGTGRFGIGASLGVRIRPLATLCKLRVTPHVAFSATHLYGVEDEGEAAFSSLDAGVRVSYRATRHLRPFATVRAGSRFAERMESGTPINYSGSGRGWGAGIEFPVTPQGRGPELAVYRLSGRFDTTEWRRVELPTDVEYRAWSVSLAWSGPFTGITPPWR